MAEKSKAYELGHQHAIAHWDFVGRYNAKPPSFKPKYPKGSTDDTDYEEGWIDGIAYAKLFDEADIFHKR